MSPKELIEIWVKLFNDGNAESLSELYHEDAVNHQVAVTPIQGREAIKQMFIDEFNVTNMVCIPENIFEDGQWAILEWKDPLGLKGSGFFHVVEGKIILQRGYWDKLSFLRIHNLPIPTE